MLSNGLVALAGGAAGPVSGLARRATWAAAPSSSAWPPSSSARSCSARCFTQLRAFEAALPWSIGAHHLLHRAAGRAPAGSGHQRSEAAHGADRGGVPGRSLLEGQGDSTASAQKGGAAPCLSCKNICKTFNPGTINDKSALNGVDPDARTTGISSPSSAATARASPPCSTPSRACGRWTSGTIAHRRRRTSPRLPEHKRAAFLGRVFQDPMMGTAADHADRGKSGARRPPRAAAARLKLGHHAAPSARTTGSCCKSSIWGWRTA